MDKQKEETKEDFCPSCLVVPLALAGAGAATVGGTGKDKHKKWKKALLISGVVTIVITLLIIFYFFVLKKDCNKCKIKL